MIWFNLRPRLISIGLKNWLRLTTANGLVRTTARWCGFVLNAPRRVPAGLARPFVMFDAVQLANYADFVRALCD